MDISLVCLIYLVGLILLLLELFAPGVFLGITGVAVLMAGITLAFWYHSPVWGISLLAIALVLVPAVLIWALKQVTLSASQNLEDGYTSTEEKFDALLGKEGISLTPLRPSGMALIDGKRIDVTAESLMLDKDTPIKVVKVEGSRLVVKATGPTKIEE
jgi:membrane-bound serine protease (ClpP class)